MSNVEQELIITLAIIGHGKLYLDKPVKLPDINALFMGSPGSLTWAYIEPYKKEEHQYNNLIDSKEKKLWFYTEEELLENLREVYINYDHYSSPDDNTIDVMKDYAGIIKNYYNDYAESCMKIDRRVPELCDRESYRMSLLNHSATVTQYSHNKQFSFGSFFANKTDYPTDVIGIHVLDIVKKETTYNDDGSILHEEYIKYPELDIQNKKLNLIYKKHLLDFVSFMRYSMKTFFPDSDPSDFAEYYKKTYSEFKDMKYDINPENGLEYKSSIVLTNLDILLSNLGIHKTNIYDFTCNVCNITTSKRPSNMLTITRDVIEPNIKRPNVGNWGGKSSRKRKQSYTKNIRKIRNKSRKGKRVKKI